MNTFANIFQECPDPADKKLKGELIAHMTRKSLTERIYQRGLVEQHRIRFAPDSYPKQAKRRSKRYNNTNLLFL